LARIFVAMLFNVCFCQAQMQQAIIFANLQALLEIVNRFLHVTAENSWCLEIDLPQSHVSAASLEPFVDFQHRLHLALDVFDVGQTRERADFGIATIIRAQPEMTLGPAGV